MISLDSSPPKFHVYFHHYITSIFHPQPIFIPKHDISSKEHEHIRIVLQNPNGISCENNFFEYQLLLEHMRSVDSDIILLPETNLCWSQNNVIMSTTKHQKNIFQFSKQVTSNSKRSLMILSSPRSFKTVVNYAKKPH